MKTLVLALTLISSSAFAIPKDALLDCNLSFGPDQAVTVRSTEKGLILEELTNTGSMVRRPLTQKEFKSGVFRLRIESPLDSGTLSFQDGQWLYDLGGAMGYADCQTPR